MNCGIVEKVVSYDIIIFKCVRAIHYVQCCCGFLCAAKFEIGDQPNKEYHLKSDNSPTCGTSGGFYCANLVPSVFLLCLWAAQSNETHRKDF